MIILVEVFLKCDDCILINDCFDSCISGSVISYDDGVSNFFDFSKCVLKRFGEDYSLSFDFKSSLCVTDYGSFDIVSDYVINSNDFFVKYQFNGSFYEYKIRWR